MSFTSSQIRKVGFIHGLADDAADEIEQFEVEERKLKDRITQLETELAAVKLSKLDKENLEIGRQLQRAANDLPDLFNIEIDVENGCAGVTLINEDGNRRSFILDEHLSDTISEAIDAAIKEQGK